MNLRNTINKISKKDAFKSKDDALSAVIAIMLILAIISICIATYVTIYVPELKQQAEITHSEDVRFTFDRLSSDIDNLYTIERAGFFTEPLSLGGGDVMLSPIKSGGTVQIENDTIGTLNIGSNKTNITMVNITFTPVYSTWEPQGYKYSRGLVWLVKDKKTTPSDTNILSIDDGKKYMTNYTASIKNNIKRSFRNYGDGNSSIDIVVMSTDLDSNDITGSGTVKIKLGCTLSDTIVTVPADTVISYTDALGTTNIHTFETKTNLTINKKNIMVSTNPEWRYEP